MRKHFEDAYPIEVQGRTRRNMVWILIFSICMMFAGFTSAYIVSMGNNFWIKVSLPTAFYISTAIIILSSLTLYLGVKAIKTNNVSKGRIYMVITLILGLGFGFSQFMGYKALVDGGAHFISGIIVDDGRYGDYFEIKKDGEYLTVENNQYYYQGERIEGELQQEFKSFAQQFIVEDIDALKSKQIEMYDYTLLYKSEPLNYLNGDFIRPNGEKLETLDFQRLKYLAQNIIDDRADFFVKGEMGKDFKLFYNKNELEYHERTLMYKGKPLSANLQNKLLRGNSDTSTAYFYIITVLHLLHVVAAIIMLSIMVKRSYSTYSVERLTIYLRAGAIFWHFLGILWIYLLLFLILIH
ncbi:MAG: hypothetical protein WC994_09285 [Brumimicrobium sp.]